MSFLLSDDLRTEICSSCRRFHLLKPEYIHHRIKELQRSFRLRILMCHVDVDDVVEPLQQITRTALLNDVTLICGWSPEVEPHNAVSSKIQRIRGLEFGA